MWVQKKTGALRNLEEVVPGNQRPSTLAPIAQGVTEGEHKEYVVESGQTSMTRQKSGGDVADKVPQGEKDGMKVGDIQCIIHGGCKLNLPMDNIGFWNIRGFNSPQKYGDIKWFLDHHTIGLFGLLKTRVRSKNFAKVLARFGGMWSVATNYHCHKGGRFWLLWIPSKFVVNIIYYSAQYIHCDVVQISSGKRWFVTMVYGFNDGKDRKQLWEDLRRLSRSNFKKIE